MTLTGYVKSVEPGEQYVGPHRSVVPVLRVTIVGAQEAEALIEVPVREGKTYYVGRRVRVSATPL